MMMRFFLALLPLLLLCDKTFADPINLIQVQRSAYGGIHADQDQYPYNGNDAAFSKYDMDLERSYAVRALYSILYLSAQRNLTNVRSDTPDTLVETAAIGFTLTDEGEEGDYFDTYFIGAIGLGAGKFSFKQPALNGWEAMLEVNLEGGFSIARYLLLGAGFTYQRFGEIGETKAELGSIYISTGIRF